MEPYREFQSDSDGLFVSTNSTAITYTINSLEYK